MRRLSWTFSSHVAFLLVVLGALWSRPGRCQRVKDTQFAFINPSGPDLSTEKNYTIGEAERLQWNATYTNITLCLVQDTAANTCEAIARNVTNRNYYIWTIRTSKDLNIQPRFSIHLLDTLGNGWIQSPKFLLHRNPTSPTSTSSTTSSVTPTPSSTTTLRAVTLGVTTPASSSASSNSRGSSRGLSRGAKVGMGVGIPAAFILGCALVFAGLLARRRRKEAAPPASQQAYHPVWTGETGGEQRNEEMTYSSSYTGVKEPGSSTVTSAELATRDPRELPAGLPPAELH